jgi:WD40 repeat protein
LLDSLRPVASAAWNAPIATDDAASASETTVSWCTPGTRVSLLKDILAWATAPNSPCVFWLNGLAGTGKSTVARTLCERLHKRNLLGASFFISRGQAARRDTSTIVHTIAHQLAFNRRPFSDALCAKLRERPLSVTRLIQDQISDFIIAPSRALPDGARFVIVIDALDESSPDSWGRPGGELLLPLVRQLLQLDGRVRVFITSRNEISIQQMFKELSAIPQTIDVVKLHELDKAVVKDDITTYLNHSFTMIRETRVDLTLTGWPSLDTVSELIERSGLLFIYAATAVRFMTHPKQSPRVRLDQLLRHNTATGTSPYVHLDGLYRQILDDAVRDSENNDLLLRQRLQAVMAVIVLAQTPLDINALATFSGESPDDVSIVIASLSSLLTDSAGGVRVFHPSFPDFAIDTTRCTDSRLCVVPAVDHSIIALRCLSLMNKDLRYNICNLRDPTVANSEIQDLELALRMNVSDVLSYAVCFWCTHLGASGAPDDAMLNALDEMCRKHLFHWIEVLSLVQHVPASEAALLKVIEWCEVSSFMVRYEWRKPDTFSWQRYPSGTTSLAISLLRDVARVLQVFATPIRSHALHAYHSAFVTMPHCLLLETLNTENLPGRIPRLVSPRAAHWGPSPRVLEGHSHWVMCVTFSRDGKRIASSSFDRTVRVWNAITFEPLAKLDGHQDEVTSVSFSPNGMHLISGSVDGTVRIWDAVAFESLAVLDHGSKVPVWSVVYPPSGEHIISGSEDGIVRVWSAITFEQHAKLEGHREPVRSVAFSPSGTYMVAASDDWTVSIWNAVTFKRIAELSHKYKVWSVSYSPDGMRILSGSIDHTVRIWDAITFKQLAVLKGHKMGVRSVAFSSDGTRIVSVSWDHTVRIWDAITFQQIGELEGHQGVAYTVAFSPDGTHMATGSRDHFVRVWNMRSSEKVATLEGHQGNIRCVAFSPDGAHITSCSDGDWTVRVWNSSTFEQLAELKGHRDEIKSVSFSHDGTHIASGSNDCTVRIWDAVSYEQLAVLEGHLNTVSSVAFSSDSTRVASGSQDFTVRIWDMVTLEQIAELRGPQHVIWSVAFSPDCTLIVSGSNDRMVHVWSGVTFELLAKLDEHRESVNSVEFSHDNKVIHSRDQSSREISWICSNSDTSMCLSLEVEKKSC